MSSEVKMPEDGVYHCGLYNYSGSTFLKITGGDARLVVDDTFGEDSRDVSAEFAAAWAKQFPKDDD